jgi:hypothetical protein
VVMLGGLVNATDSSCCFSRYFTDLFFKGDHNFKEFLKDSFDRVNLDIFRR